MRHEVVGIEFCARFVNPTQDQDYTGWLQMSKRVENNRLPNFVDGWEDHTGTFAPGDVDTFKNVIYIHPIDPTTVGVDSFTIESMMQKGSSPYDEFVYYQVRVYIHVNELEYEIPELLPEPEFTRGLTNTIYWLPIEEPESQDAYYFDIEDKTNLNKSLQRLYRAVRGDTVHTPFENLVHGRTYGYFIKSVYNTASGPLSLYTEFNYSTQDNMPPDPVDEIDVIITGDNRVLLFWNGVFDGVSGFERYRIYRAADTGPEEMLLELPWLGVGPFTYQDATVDTGITYYYRIRAVDAVGNEGDGDRTFGILLGSQGGTYVPPVDTTVTDPIVVTPEDHFIRGSIDTLWIKLDGKEQFVRFEVARDSASYVQTPPSASMRYFDSGWFPPVTLRNMGWFDPSSPDRVYFIFDYSDTGRVWIDSTGIVHFDTGGTHIDKNFVNGHTYFRRLTRRYRTTDRFTWLDAKLPDCYQPDEIFNLKVQTVIDDPNFSDPASGYSKWHINVSWEPAMDPVSGIKRYHVYRMVEGLDTVFMPLDLPNNFRNTSLIDTLTSTGRDTISNPIVQYRVVAEDYVGHMRDPDDTSWEAQDRALGEPFIVFGDTSDADIIPWNFVEQDTIFTRKDIVILQMLDFDLTDVLDYIVSINGVESFPIQLFDTNRLVIQLPDEEILNLKVRAVYRGERSSIWSRTKVVIRALNRAPDNFTVTNDTTNARGDVTVSWLRPSLDGVGYIIWRDSSMVDTMLSVADTLRWVDAYGIDELTGLPGDTLVAYQMVHYQLQMINLFGDTSLFSGIDSSYSNRPPLIVRDEVFQQNDHFEISISWNRAFPTLVDSNYTTEIRIFEDSLGTVVFSDTVSDTTSYTFTGAVDAKDYLFQVKEIPNDLGGLSSSWSELYIVPINKTPTNLVVWNDPEKWDGDSHLQWRRPSENAVQYEVWRWGMDSVWAPVDTTVFSSGDTIHWSDGYGIDELTDQPGDTLITYAMYKYKVRTIYEFEDHRTVYFSNIDSTYCNRSPKILTDEVVQYNGEFKISIYWERAEPSLVDTNYTTQLQVFSDSLSSLLFTDTIDDTTSYTFMDAVDDRDYLFKIREIPNDLVDINSGWSELYIIPIDKTPKSLVVWNDPERWEGDIYLQWTRPSENAVQYEVWRWGLDSVWIPIDTTVLSTEDTIRWTDTYGIDELTDQPGDTLNTYAMYKYKVRTIYEFDDQRIVYFSNVDSSYCNRSPIILRDEVAQRNTDFDIKIDWERPRYNLVDNDFTVQIQIFADSLGTLLFTDTVDDTTSYTYLDAVDGKDYLFQVKEVPDSLEDRPGGWSELYIVPINTTPKNLNVWHDTLYWEGDIHLQWMRPSENAVQYEVWRWSEDKDWSPVDSTVISTEDTIRWSDGYGIDELTQQPGDTLNNYEMYKYKVRTIYEFEKQRFVYFSNIDSAYCNRPPSIESHDIIDARTGEIIMVIHWDRVRPTKASASWKTRVMISQDTLSNIVYLSDNLSDPLDATSFAYTDNVLRGHNYIFRIQETPLAPSGRPSSWSQPYTINLAKLDSLFVQPQPKGSMFVSWDEDTLVDNLPVEYFDLCRIQAKDTVRVLLSSGVTSYMDSYNLHHGLNYEYCVSAMDSLGQIVATNSKWAVCDTGLVYIPDRLHIDTQYFNTDSIDVSWQWKDEYGNPLTGSTRGAAFLRVQLSVHENFPSIFTITATTDWIPADTLNRQIRVRIPDAVNMQNDTVYCRVTAKDRWDHPIVAIWSSTSITIFDPFFPKAVNTLSVGSTEAYFGLPDTIIAHIQWSGSGVEWPGDQGTPWSTRIGNVANYRVIRRSTAGDEQTIQVLPVFTVSDLIDTTHIYQIPDTVKNAEYHWRIVSIDSAGNETQSIWFGQDFFVPTPEPPIPTGFKTCQIQPVQWEGGANIEYFVEIAQLPEHFQLGYEVDEPDLIDRLLCRSGWIEAMDFVCGSGWGSIVMDTTWFRVKARVNENWESGWSQLMTYPNNDDGTQKTGVLGLSNEIPKVFKVQPNYPNPFNAQTVIAYQLPVSGKVEIHVVNVLGALVKTLIDESKPAGYHSVVWNGRDDQGRYTASGVYFCRVYVKPKNGQVFNKWMKMTVIK